MRKDTSSFAPGMERGAGIGSAVFVVAFLKAASAASREFGVLCFNFVLASLFCRGNRLSE